MNQPRWHVERSAGAKGGNAVEMAYAFNAAGETVSVVITNTLARERYIMRVGGADACCLSGNGRVMSMTGADASRLYSSGPEPSIVPDADHRTASA